MNPIMPDVLGIVGVSLTCLHGCVKCLTILSKAKHYKRDISDIRLQIELVQHALFTWAEEAGLTQDPPTLLICANKACFVPEVLGQLEKLLSDLTDLKNRYGLQLQSTSEEVKQLDDDGSVLSKLGPKQREYLTRADRAVFSKRTSPWKILRWIALDDKKMAELLERIKRYTDELEKFLEYTKQSTRHSRLEASLRDVILNARNQQELQIIEHEYEQGSSKIAIAASARLKQMRIKLGFSDSLITNTAVLRHSPTNSLDGSDDSSSWSSGSPSSSASSDSSSMRLSMRLLTISRSARAQSLRTLAQYNGQTILLEWKNVPDLDLDIIQNRVNQVAALLGNLGPSFNSLPCRGYVKDQVSKRYGYIFDLPRDLQPILSSYSPLSQDSTKHCLRPELKTLRQLINESDNIPSLNDRLAISVTLLETLLNLHTSGWLHKELRADNIIFIRAVKGKGGADKLDMSEYSIYIAGYVYSRIDGPSEMTEPLESGTGLDLYRHPSLLSKSRESYRKSFDIFSAGCTLLEIGLWSTLPQTFRRHSSVSESPQEKTRLNRSPSSSMTLINKDSEGCGEVEDVNLPCDLMKLKHELLLSPLTRRDSHGSENQKLPFDEPNESPVIQSLEAATGKLYTSVVKEFLLAGDISRDVKVNEHEYALDLEMKARDTVKSILEAI